MQQKGITDAFKILGAWMPSSSTNTKQFQMNNLKLLQIVNHILPANISESETVLLAPEYIRSKLRCMFSSTTFNKEEVRPRKKPFALLYSMKWYS